MKWILALMIALGLGLEARAQAAPPLTLATLFTVSPQEAAARVFGPTPEAFVERSPWNSLRPNFVMGTANQFEMNLFTKPERIAPSVCAVTMGWAIFDTGPPKGASDEDKAALAKLGYSERPLKLNRWNRSRQYFEAGPAPATPAAPGGTPVAPPGDALAKDSCANPVAARERFEAPSDEVAVLFVSKLNAVAAAAKRTGPLPFRVAGECGGQSEGCRMRRFLANLKVGWTNSLKLNEGCTGWHGSDLARGTKRCLRLDLADPSDPDAFWPMMFMLGKSDQLLEVYVGGRAVFRV